MMCTTVATPHTVMIAASIELTMLSCSPDATSTPLVACERELHDGQRQHEPSQAAEARHDHQHHQQRRPGCSRRPSSSSRSNASSTSTGSPTSAPCGYSG